MVKRKINTVKRKKKRNYAKEAEWASSPEQIRRRVERNRDRRAAIKKYGKAALKGKEVDHLGSSRRGSLASRKTRIVSKSINRKRQPKTKARGRARNRY